MIYWFLASLAAADLGGHVAHLDSEDIQAFRVDDDKLLDERGFPAKAAKTASDAPKPSPTTSRPRATRWS